jgi:polysaccharide biosynthesis/export protein
MIKSSFIVFFASVLFPLVSWGGQQNNVTDLSPIKASYVLSPEDQISIHVLDLEEVSDKPTRIDPNGYIELPLVGRLHAGGLSVEELRRELTTKLEKFIHGPQITIGVLEYHSQPVSIVGAVNTPGVHQLQGPKHLIEVISAAGGLRQDAGPRVIITRQSQSGAIPLIGAHADPSGNFTVAEVSIDELMSAKNPAENILIRPNDVISVPRAEVVYVLGQVKKAGGFTLNSHDGISLLRALSLAEGLERDAAPKKARIMKGPLGDTTKVNEVAVDVQKILDGKSPDIQMHANDVLFIPNNLARSTMRRAAEAALQVGTGIVIYR